LGMASDLQPLSPELVLVDPALTETVRGIFSGLPHNVEDGIHSEGYMDSEAHAALRRIVAWADAPPPTNPARFQLAKLFGAVTTWVIALVLVVDTHLYSIAS
jgi:hypothetical protein